MQTLGYSSKTPAAHKSKCCTLVIGGYLTKQSRLIHVKTNRVFRHLTPFIFAIVFAAISCGSDLKVELQKQHSLATKMFDGLSPEAAQEVIFVMRSSLLKRDMDVVRSISPAIFEALESDQWFRMDPFEKYRFAVPELLSHWGSDDIYGGWGTTHELETRMENLDESGKRNFVSMVDRSVDHLLLAAVRAESLARSEAGSSERISSILALHSPTAVDVESWRTCTDLVNQSNGMCLVKSEELLLESLNSCFDRLESTSGTEVLLRSEECRFVTPPSFWDSTHNCMMSRLSEDRVCLANWIQQFEQAAVEAGE